MRTGERAGYRIVEWVDGTDGAIEDLVECCPELLFGRYVAIASCDSGPYAPTGEEFTEGWCKFGELAVSPPVKAISELPMPGFDEWYVYDELIKFESHSNFVNRIGFSPLHANDKHREILDAGCQVEASARTRVGYSWFVFGHARRIALPGSSSERKALRDARHA
jgi:hypothetical protein